MKEGHHGQYDSKAGVNFWLFCQVGEDCPYFFSPTKQLGLEKCHYPLPLAIHGLPESCIQLDPCQLVEVIKEESLLEEEWPFFNQFLHSWQHVYIAPLGLESSLHQFCYSCPVRSSLALVAENELELLFFMKKRLLRFSLWENDWLPVNAAI